MGSDGLSNWPFFSGYLDAIDRLLAVEQNLQARELNAGWARLFRAAVAIHKLISP